MVFNKTDDFCVTFARTITSREDIDDIVAWE